MAAWCANGLLAKGKAHARAPIAGLVVGLVVQAAGGERGAAEAVLVFVHGLLAAGNGPTGEFGVALHEDVEARITSIQAALAADALVVAVHARAACADAAAYGAAAADVVDAQVEGEARVAVFFRVVVAVLQAGDAEVACAAAFYALAVYAGTDQAGVAAALEFGLVASHDDGGGVVFALPLALAFAHAYGDAYAVLGTPTNAYADAGAAALRVGLKRAHQHNALKK